MNGIDSKEAKEPGVDVSVNVDDAVLSLCLWMRTFANNCDAPLYRLITLIAQQLETKGKRVSDAEICDILYDGSVTLDHNALMSRLAHDLHPMFRFLMTKHGYASSFIAKTVLVLSWYGFDINGPSSLTDPQEALYGQADAQSWLDEFASLAMWSAVRGMLELPKEYGLRVGVPISTNRKLLMQAGTPFELHRRDTVVKLFDACPPTFLRCSTLNGAQDAWITLCTSAHTSDLSHPSVWWLRHLMSNATSQDEQEEQHECGRERVDLTAPVGDYSVITCVKATLHRRFQWIYPTPTPQVEALESKALDTFLSKRDFDKTKDPYKEMRIIGAVEECLKEWAEAIGVMVQQRQTRRDSINTALPTLLDPLRQMVFEYVWRPLASQAAVAEAALCV